MAPLRRKVQQTSARKAASGRGAMTSTKRGLFGDDFRTTKRDKRVIKHSTFVSKVEKSYMKTPKRRRLSKKLITTLDSLADALPASEEMDQNDNHNQAHITKNKILKHRPGAMKRREKLEQMERDRFMKNLAQMNGIEEKAQNPTVASFNDSAELTSTSNRWAALRGFLSQTMEQQAAFKK